MNKAILVGGVLIVAAAGSGAGCDNRHLIGAVDGGGGTGQQPSDDGGSQDGAIVMPVESWTGYIENFKFPSGSDAVKISFAVEAGTGQVIGTVIFGNGTPPPPPTDPNVGYPPGYIAGFPAASFVQEGYGYTVRNGTLAGSRLKVGVRLVELWTGWCALQTPVDSSGFCVHNNPATGQDEPIDCAKLRLCEFDMVCRCDASAGTCAVTIDGDYNDISFDVTVDVTAVRADGSVVGNLGDANGNYNVHFTKDP